MQRMTMRSTARGQSGARSRSGGGASRGSACAGASLRVRRPAGGRRAHAAQQLVEDDAEREQIAPRVDDFAEELLGRHVRGRSERRPCCSGAIRTRAVISSAEASSARVRGRCAMLKSTIFTSPVRERITLAGLTSRWTTPRSWACASAAQTPRRPRASPGRRASLLGSPLTRRRRASWRASSESEARDVLEHEVPAPGLALHVVEQQDDVRVREPGEDARLAFELLANVDVGGIVALSALSATLAAERLLRSRGRPSRSRPSRARTTVW